MPKRTPADHWGLPESAAVRATSTRPIIERSEIRLSTKRPFRHSLTFSIQLHPRPCSFRCTFPPRCYTFCPFSSFWQYPVRQLSRISLACFNGRKDEWGWLVIGPERAESESSAAAWFPRSCFVLTDGCLPLGHGFLSSWVGSCPPWLR